MTELEEKLCKRCGYSWLSIVNSPRQCPRCKSTRWQTSKIEETEAKKKVCKWCGHVWQTRKQEEPLQCPGCKRYNWKGEK